MATPTTQPSQSTTPDAASRAQLIHNVSLGALIVCPLIMALPPRKLDLYTGLLLTGTFLGGNQLAYEYTGRSFVARCKARLEAVQGLGEGSLPEKARVMQGRLREERERRKRSERGSGVGGAVGRPGVLGEVRRMREEEEDGDRKEQGILQRVWMGGEGVEWKAKRNAREKEALEEGKGYSGLIKDQIWEVWNWGKDKVEEVKEKDEEVVRRTKEDEDGKKK